MCRKNPGEGSSGPWVAELEGYLGKPLQRKQEGFEIYGKDMQAPPSGRKIKKRRILVGN